MQLTNISKTPLYLQFVGPCGQNLRQEQKSNQFELRALTNPTLWKLLDEGRVRLHLTANERALLERVLEEDTLELPAPPEPVTPPQPEEPAPKPKKRRTKKKDDAETEPDAAVEAPAVPVKEVKRGEAGSVSLADLQAHNKAVSSRPTNIPYNRNGIPGQPDFGTNTRPTKKESLENAQSVLGSIV